MISKHKDAEISFLSERVSIFIDIDIQYQLNFELFDI